MAAPVAAKDSLHQLTVNSPNNSSTTAPCKGTVFQLNPVIRGTFHRPQMALLQVSLYLVSSQPPANRPRASSVNANFDAMIP